MDSAVEHWRAHQFRTDRSNGRRPLRCVVRITTNSEHGIERGGVRGGSGERAREQMDRHTEREALCGFGFQTE